MMNRRGALRMAFCAISFLAACQNAEPSTRGLALHYAAPDTTEIRLPRADGRDLTLTVTRNDREVALVLKQGEIAYYQYRGAANTALPPVAFSSLDRASAGDVARLVDALGAARAPELDPQGEAALALARRALVQQAASAVPDVTPQCQSRGCDGVCGAGCSSDTCECELVSPPAFERCEGRTGVYSYGSAFHCYTSACCQTHDSCLGTREGSCLDPSCIACHAAALADGCAPCIGNGFAGCSSGGYYSYFDTTTSWTYVYEDPACCDPHVCDEICQSPAAGGAPYLAGSCSSGGGSCACSCDAGRCDSYCEQTRGIGSVGSCAGGGCSCSLPPSCIVECQTNCGQLADTAPGCPLAYCPDTDTCESLGQTWGSVCGIPCGPPPCDDTCLSCGMFNGCGDYCGDCIPPGGGDPGGGDPGGGDPGGGDPGGGTGGGGIGVCWDGSECVGETCSDDTPCFPIGET